MEQRRCSVLGGLLLGALALSASACGMGKKEADDKAATVDTPATTGVVVESSAQPAITVPPPTPVVPPPAPTPTPAKVETKDPVAESKAVVACCVAIRGDASRMSAGTERAKMLNVAKVCSDLAPRVKKGESTRDKTLSAVKAAAGGAKLPSACN
ncbi:MAG TPA: hypothetical protein VFS00_19275 [Polyangiaceae bacterium]|nr:hypothetical protein [Polyangiaceae bacterium]